MSSEAAGTSGTKRLRRRVIIHCNEYGITGHNSATCKSEATKGEATKPKPVPDQQPYLELVLQPTSVLVQQPTSGPVQQPDPIPVLQPTSAPVQQPNSTLV
ncbi:hypothetical protein ACH5RR_009390 [Cinchona calisaya]|uniref:Uncharacterized protein n=1 Tax=Cinchona calisaya TaxID=153742 RepID=A0ABD3AEW6_9GENT